MSDLKPTTAKSKPLLATFLTCVLIGPPVGALAIAFSLNLESSNASDFGLWTALFFTPIMIPFSYTSGGLLALASGLAMVAYGWFKGMPPLWFAIGCAVAVYAILQSVQTDQSTGAAMSLLAAHVVPAVVCWSLFRRFWSVRT
jgi:hypothetical protein